MTEKEALIKHMNLCFRLYRKIVEGENVLYGQNFRDLKHMVDVNTKYLRNSCYLCNQYTICGECPLRLMNCDLDGLCKPHLKITLKNNIVTAYKLAVERLLEICEL